MQATSTGKETATLTYSQHPNSIHEFTVKVSSRAAVDDLMEIFATLYATTPNTQILRRLFVIQMALPSVSYTIQKTRALIARYPNPPKSRNAIIYKDNLALSLLRTSIRFLPFAMPLALYHPDERDRAIVWLLRD